jgi:glycosyltransferase involved in cell wall biosynthesis
MTISHLRITHIITSLDTGGAEMMLYRLAKELKEQQYEQHIICLRPLGQIADLLIQAGIPVTSIGMNFGFPSYKNISNLVRLIKDQKPDIVQTWMYHADLLGGIATILAGKIPIVWGIHNSTVDLKLIKFNTFLVIKFCAFLSNWLPTRIVSCSQQAREVHVRAGYKDEKFLFIPNGIDINVFHPNRSAHANLRKYLGIQDDTKIIGLIARFHPQKDIENFLKAADLINEKRPEIHFVLCGDGMTSQNLELARWVSRGHNQNTIHLLGRRLDIPWIMAGLDILALSSSFGEAFPLVLGESMASGIPCVSTDVGDSAYLIGDTGLIVAPRDPRALAGAIMEMISLPDKQIKKMGEDARLRIEQNFSLIKMVDSYLRLYEQIRKPNLAN